MADTTSPTAVSDASPPSKAAASGQVGAAGPADLAASSSATPTVLLQRIVASVAEVPFDAPTADGVGGELDNSLSEEPLLKPFLGQAAGFAKNLFVLIVSEWDDYSFKMSYLIAQHKDVAPIFNKYFVCCKFQDGNGENSDVVALRDKLGGNKNEFEEIGVFYAFLDPSGKVLARSVLDIMYNVGDPTEVCRENVGYPRHGLSESHFMNMIDRAAPYMTDEEWNTIRLTVLYVSVDGALGPHAEGWIAPPLPLEDGSQAAQALKKGMQLAGFEDKNVFLLIGTLECIECEMVARMFATEIIGPILQQVLVLVDLRSAPGVDNWYMLLSGSTETWDAGVPLYAIVTPKGDVIVSSMIAPDTFRGQYNIGYPTSVIGISWFMTMLERGAPALNARRRSDILHFLNQESAGDFVYDPDFDEPKKAVAQPLSSAP